jgi:hypothetical protein
MRITYKTATNIIKNIENAIKNNDKITFVDYVKNSSENSKYFVGDEYLSNLIFSLYQYGIEKFELGV